MRRGFAANVAFTTRADLPGDRTDIALFHYAIDGLIFDRLSVPGEPETPSGAIASALLAHLLS